MRKLFLLGMMVLSMQSAQAVNIGSQGIVTDFGFLTWDSLVKSSARIEALESKVSLLRNALIFGSVLVAGAFIYMQWSKKAKNEQVTDAKLEEKNA
jgi:hypothetical protein